MKRIVEELSIKDAARRLGVSIRYIRDLVWSGQLEAEKTAGVWRIPSDAVEARLKARQVRDAGN